jgi:hypothetical protein
MRNGRRLVSTYSREVCWMKADGSLPPEELYVRWLKTAPICWLFLLGSILARSGILG